MEDVTELISKVSQELGADASDEEISEKVREAIEALPESDRAQVLDQLVKGVSSGQLRHLDKQVDARQPRRAGLKPLEYRYGPAIDPARSFVGFINGIQNDPRSTAAFRPERPVR